VLAFFRSSVVGVERTANLVGCTKLERHKGLSGLFALSVDINGRFFPGLKLGRLSQGPFLSPRILT
jgi:hypothetical protein